MSTRKPIIFISYAHADEPEKPGPEEVQWLSFVTGYLRPALKHGAVDIWVDRLMKGGADWEREIAAKLRACDIFVLLVSRHSMSSDYVVDKELAIVRKREAMGEDVHFFPLLLTPTPKLVLDLVRDRNLRPRNGKPFSAYSLHERYERMSEAADEIAEIAASVAWKPVETLPIYTPADESETQDGKSSGVWDEKSLRAWLGAQRREVSIVFAVRAAMRVLPFVALATPKRQAKKATRQFVDLASAVFRACALARAVGKYPARASELGADAGAGAATRAGINFAGTVAFRVARVAAVAAAATSADVAVAAATAAGSPAEAAAYAATAAADSAAAEAAAYAKAATADSAASAATEPYATWREIKVDVDAVQSIHAAALSDAPLWSNRAPEAFDFAWNALRNALPKTEHWNVWLDWYRDRLEGVSHSEGYELVFATVPLDVWEQGHAAANAWIAERLPKNAPTLNRDGIPNPIPDLPAPFTYSWTPNQRVAIVAGPQNLPFFSHFKSEEEHRQVLEACRVGAERLLKLLGEGHFHNVGPFYAPTLRNYLDDLPKTAGQGNILVAHDEALHLRKMFLADVDALPAAFASRLERVISNQFALDGFYDLVRRHNEAVASAKWAQAFPTDAAREFFGVVEANTPKFFEAEVAEKVQRIEATAEGETEAPAPSVLSSTPQPPPLPAGSPDPKRSAEHQVASSANALYEVFLNGKDLPMAVEGWSRVAHALGDAIGPILTFLKGL